MKQLVRGAVLALLLSSQSAWAENLPGATVGSLLVIARENSPEYRMARLEAEALSERIQPAGALPDPAIRIEFENITKNASQAPTLNPSDVGDTKYSFLQPLPFWGKRDLKRDIADAEARQATGRANTRWSEISSQIKSLYARYWVSGKSLVLLKENVALTEQLEKIAQTRYASGLAPQQDAIRAQVEKSTLESDLINMETELSLLTHSINAMLSRPGRAPLAQPQELRPVPAITDGASLLARLLQINPQLSGEMARLTAAEKTRELAYRNRYPDFVFGVVPIQNQSSFDTWSLMLEMNIPLQQNTRRSQERESEKSLEAAAARKEALQYRLQSEFYGTISNLEASRLTEQITRDRLLPQAEVTFQSALSAYENGKVDFATLLDAQRQIRNARLAILRMQSNQQIRLAEIERMLGEDL